MSGETNWARNLEYGGRIAHPDSVEAVQELVRSSPGRLKALGTRHSFSTAADSDGVQIALDRLPMGLVVDEQAKRATVAAGARMGDVAQALDAAGWGFANLASLPHIGLAGAVATSTHGSGDALGTLSSMVRGIDSVLADGSVLHTEQGDADFPGAVVGIGALGIATSLTIAIEPTSTMRQDAYPGVRWDALDADFDRVMASGDSVSVFTDWASANVGSVLVKQRARHGAPELLGVTAVEPRPADEAAADLRSTPIGVEAPWWDVLPHFRITGTPSVGDELQSEYFIPRAARAEAFAALRAMGDRIAEALHASEIRTVAGDDLWLSGAHGGDVVTVGFTWKPRPDLVRPLLAPIEERLLPLGARPHFGKLFHTRELAGLYPHWADFVALRDRLDPERRFANAFLLELMP